MKAIAQVTDTGATGRRSPFDSGRPGATAASGDVRGDSDLASAVGRRRERGSASILSPPVLSWAFYDFANTIFSYVVVTRYFTEWIVIDKGQPDAVIGLMTVCVSLLLVVALPSFGALADRLGRHKPLLVTFSLTCIAATALLGVVDGVLISLVIAGLAIFSYNSADAQYHPLLAAVAPPEARGRVSGFGAAVGYVGSIGALVVVGGLVADGGNQEAFLPTAVLFLVFALPCFLFVREQRPARRTLESSVARAVARVPSDALRQLVASVRRAWRRPHGRFLLARFLYVDALATLVAFISVYARRTGEFSAGEISLLLGFATLFAVAGAFLAGRLMDRFGPKKVLVSTVLAAAGAIFAVGVTGAPWVLWAAAPVVGAAIGSVTACDRVYMLRLIPPEHRGEDFGLYALTGRLSNGFGALVLWGGTVALLTELLNVMSPFEASRVAVCVLALSAVAGLLVLRRLPDVRCFAPEDEVALRA